MPIQTLVETKQATLSAATAAREAAENAAQETADKLAEAQARHASVKAANAAGDAAVTAMGLVSAAAEVERYTGLAAATKGNLEQARYAEHEATADLVAEEVLAEFDPPKVEARLAELADQLKAVVGEYTSLMHGREKLLDEVGARLDRAGAPTQTLLAGRLSYRPVWQLPNSYEHTPAPGRWTLAVDGELLLDDHRKGSTEGIKDCADEIARAITSALSAHGWHVEPQRFAVARKGWKWSGNAGPAEIGNDSDGPVTGRSRGRAY